VQLVFSRVCRRKLRNFAQKLKELYKKLKDLKKTQGYEALSGLMGLQKVDKKQAWYNTYY